MKKKIGIVICNYNKKDYVLQCIASVLQQTYQEFDIYVVDNASTDGSAQAIREEYGDKVILIENQKNLGGSGGFNTGMRCALKQNYPYLLLLDNDVKLAEDAVEILYRTMEEHPEIGFQGCKILKMDFPEIIQEFAARVDYTNVTVDMRHAGEKDSDALTGLEDCDSLPACALLVRRDVVRAIGFMPQENFVSWDDIEWCVRCIRAGYRVVANGSAKAWHKGGETVSLNTFGAYYGHRNRIAFFLKYMQTEKTGQSADNVWIQERADKILDDLFRAVYACNYAGRYNRLKTIMDAFLDALQGKNGKSQEYQIRDNDAVENRFEKILSGTDCVAIDINGFSKAAPKIITRIRQYYSAQGKKSDILLYSSIPCEERQILGCLIQEHIAVQKEIPSFKICSHVFDVPGEKFEQMWIDSWCNVILNEHDFLMCQAYQENYRLFQMYFKDRLVELIKNADVNE